MIEWVTEKSTSWGFWDGTAKDGTPTGGFGPIEGLKPRADWAAQGKVYRQLRHDRGETLGECARRVGITVVELSGLERGVAGTDHDEMVRKISG